MRIFITGNAGAGKSTLACAVGEALNLPVFGLDRIVWRPGWQKATQEERELEIAGLIQSSDRWVIEGVSQPILEAADVIIFLDIPRSRCLFGCMKRNWRYLFRSRPDLPERCPELLIIPRLLRIIWGFKGNVRPRIMAEIERQRGSKVIFQLKDRPTPASFVVQLREAVGRSGGDPVASWSR